MQIEVLKVAVRYFIEVLMYLIFFRALLSWLPLGQNRLTNFLDAVTEPVVKPIRSLLSKSSFLNNMSVDFSPFFAFLLLSFLSSLFM